IESMRHQWPNLEIKVFGSGHSLIADERALRSIIGNIIQNALIHGKAKVLTFEIQAGSLRFRDDGVGFKGDWQMLGDMFHRHTTTSGSGL
ncbi:ATP-binding protein, partial [Shewanella algae]|uniref:ATP-binding protein n=1 Tax=Shewanella algae TaxID=38313 RepID=UPI00313BB395